MLEHPLKELLRRLPDDVVLLAVAEHHDRVGGGLMRLSRRRRNQARAPQVHAVAMRVGKPDVGLAAGGQGELGPRVVRGIKKGDARSTQWRDAQDRTWTK